MNKDKIQIIVIAVGILIFAAVMAGNLKKKPTKKPAKPAGEKVSASEKPKSVSLPSGAAGAEAMGTQLERAQIAWGRDPFSQPLDQEYQLSELVLKGISFSKDRKGYAFINDEIVTEGDTIGNCEVVEVKKERVLLRKAGQSFYLTFPAEQ